MFGTDMIIKDIIKVTSLKKNTIERILPDIDFNNEIKNENMIDKKLFSDDIYRKIKKRLIYDIAFARIKEISEIVLSRNMNLKYYVKTINKIFLEVNDKLQKKSFIKIYKLNFTLNNKDNIEFLDGLLAILRLKLWINLSILVGKRKQYLFLSLKSPLLLGFLRLYLVKTCYF